jgi:hypothetical protein
MKTPFKYPFIAVALCLIITSGCYLGDIISWSNSHSKYQAHIELLKKGNIYRDIQCDELHIMLDSVNELNKELILDTISVAEENETLIQESDRLTFQNTLYKRELEKR